MNDYARKSSTSSEDRKLSGMPRVLNYVKYAALE